MKNIKRIIQPGQFKIDSDFIHNSFASAAKVLTEAQVQDKAEVAKLQEFNKEDGPTNPLDNSHLDKKAEQLKEQILSFLKDENNQI